MIASAGAALNIGLNLILIGPYGGVGAAWATVATFVATALGVAIASSSLRIEALRMIRSANLLAAAHRLHRGMQSD